jgi:glycosyltransferase involved in cell wall biosynthesis
MRVGIIIPAYNEEKRIGPVLDSYSEFLDSKLDKSKFDYQIFVVINATKDNTAKIVGAAKKKNKRIDFVDLKKGGKGYAIMEGFKIMIKKGYDLIGYVDADVSTSPNAFYDLIQNIENADAIIASRYIRGAVVSPKQVFMRIIASRVFNFLVRSLFLMPYRDTQCGAKIIRREALESVVDELGDTQWSFDIDLLFHLRNKGFYVKEWPTVWKDSADSKLNLKKVSIQMFFSIIQLRIFNSPFRDLLKIISPVTRSLWGRLKNKK